MEPLHALIQKNAVEKAFSSKTQQQLETYPRSELTEQISEIREIQNGDTRKHKDFHAERRMGNVNRFQGRLLPYPNKPTFQEYLHFHVQDQSYRFEALPFGLSTAQMEFTVVVKEVKHGSKQGYKNPPVPRRLVRATSHQTCLHYTQTLVAMCQELGWIVNMEKSEVEPKQIFESVGYQYTSERARSDPLWNIGRP